MIPEAAMVREAIAAVLLLVGALFMLLAAVGILRMPDLLMRMQAATKAAALGASSMFLAVMVYFWDSVVTARAAGAIVFIFLTLPLGAHLMARASYLTGVVIWQGTKTGLPDPYEEEHVVDDIDERETVGQSGPRTRL